MRKELLSCMDQLHASLASLPYASRPPFEITGPVMPGLYDKGSPSAQASAEAMAKRMLLYLNLPFVTPRVTIVYMRDNASTREAGSFHGDKFRCDIRINKCDCYRFKQVNAILAHECMHYFLMFHDLTHPDERINELLTDVSAVYVGFGELLRDGYTPIETSWAQSGNVLYSTVTHTLGYITVDEIDGLMRRRWELAFPSAAAKDSPQGGRRREGTRWRAGRKEYLVIGCVGILWFCLSAFGLWKALSPLSAPRLSRAPAPTLAPVPSPTPVPTPTPKPSPVSNGQIFKYPEDERLAPLTVKTSGSGGYYVYLKSCSYEGNDMSFYVKGGRSVEIDVPLDTYELWYCAGTTWYGVEDKFGEDTSNHKAKDDFDFYEDGDYVNGWTVSLYRVPHGNLSTEEVEDFPD